MRAQEQHQPSVRRTPFENHALRWLTELESQVGVLRQLLSEELGTTICERCRRGWFLALPCEPDGPTGDGRGLTLAGTPCCSVCVDALYSITATMDAESSRRALGDMARWLNRYPTALPPTSPWVQDPDVQELRRRFAIMKRVPEGPRPSKIRHLVSLKGGQRRSARGASRH